MRKLFLATSTLLFVGFIACKPGASNGPIAALQAMKTDAKKKDIDALKKNMCKDNIAFLESALKMAATLSGKTVEELMKESVEKGSVEYTADDVKFTNEKINGDKATVDVEDGKGSKKQTLDFIKEDGKWKICVDIASKMKESGFNGDVNKGMDDLKKGLGDVDKIKNNPEFQKAMNDPKMKEIMKKVQDDMKDPEKMKAMQKQVEELNKGLQNLPK